MFCGACGRSMQVRYQDRYPRYECSHSRADHVAAPLCGSVRADTIDEAVTAALLAAVGPAQVALALAAAEEVTTRRQRSVGPRGWLPSGRATTLTGPSGPSWPASRRTGWSPAAWRPAGRPGSLTWPKPRPRSPRSAPPGRPARPRPASRHRRRSARPVAAPTTSDKDRKRLLRTLLGDVTLTPSASNPAEPERRAALEIRRKPAGPGHPPQERHPAARHRSRRDRARLPHRPRPGQQRPGRRAQRRRAPHRHRPALRRRRRRQPAELPPHPLSRPPRRRRAHAPPGRPADRRVHRHHPLLDQRRLPRRPPRARPDAGAIPFPPDVEAACRDRAAGSAHQHRRHRPGAPPPGRAEHRRRRPPPRRQARRHLRMG